MRRRARAAWAAILLAASAGGAAAQSGRALYQGHAPFAAGREATANRLPPAHAACANCHGADAAGRREGGVVAPPLGWAALTRPGQGAGAYAEAAALRAAVTHGIGRDGRSLDPAMPRYRLEAGEWAALLDYLRIAGTPADRPPGVAADHVALGTVLPLSGRAAATGAAVLAGLEAGLAEARVHGRRLVLQAVDGASLGTVPAVRRLLARPVFALLGGIWPEDAAAEALLAEARVAHIGSLLTRAREDATGAWAVDLLAPLSAQQATLAAALRHCPAEPRLGLLVAPVEAGGPGTTWLADPAGLMQAVGAAGPAGCLGTSLAGAARIDGRRLPAGWRWQVVLPFPAALLEGEGAARPDPWRRLGFAAARLAVETLAQAGLVLTERAPLAALPAHLEPWPGAALHFGPRRRQGWDPGLIELSAPAPATDAVAPPTPEGG
ncbi:c-type cytochrome [Roseicella sp. DB1501]|uniref:c-type cytochrome n=1 Tax=Roseicella sp. DB1501 TaxID=2730925 RepID=UPI00149324FA|nr:c-type cytochrome [Roseicella sp. DB1501]